MFTIVLTIAAALLACFFGGTFWLAAIVTGFILVKLFPLVAILIVLAAIGLIAFR